jgi:ERCC4-type nuclease
MVQVSIHIRPTTGYHYPNKIDHLQIDSADRLETIQQRYSTAGSTTRLYYGGHELPLNSSIGSHDFDDGAILECCRSPAMSAALTACLNDFERIRKIPASDRTMENLIRILQTPVHIKSDRDHEMWESWTNDRLKTRTINLATIKAVLQRQHRYHVHDLPICDDCHSLYLALEKHKVWTGVSEDQTTRSVFKQQAHIFKPHKKDGNPSTNFVLVEEKLRIQEIIRREFSAGLLRFTPGYDSPPEDWLEEFVRRDNARHCTEQSSSGCNDIADFHLAHLVNSPPRRNSPSRSNGSRSNDGTSSVGATSSPVRASYIPQYASGPFAVLAALHLAMHSKHQHSNGRRLLTLTEDQLKRMAQPLCRSNLYDKGRIRGRNAFACMDGLIEKQLVRKEIVRNAGAGGEVEKWGLLRDAEVLGEKCADFDHAVNHVIPLRNIDVTHVKANVNLALCLDTREDVHLLERIKMTCEDEKVPFVERELPAGDYLFIDQSGSREYVLPLVVERKSWSDLADSCLGKGRALNRLDCVKLGSTSGCSGNCQLCKMKNCGCRRVMFIIEGERCLGSDSVHRTAKKCTKENCCSACRLLIERHDVTQNVLEGVLHRLQIEHGCLIHYTKSYNETISSLFDMRKLLQTGSNSLYGEPISFESYASNARRKSLTNVGQVQPRPTRVQDLNFEKVVALVGSCEWDLDLVRSLCAEIPDQARPNYPPSRKKSEMSDVIELNDSDHGDSFINLDCPNEGSTTKPSKRGQTNNEMICLDSESDDEILLVTEIRGGGDTYNLFDDDGVDAFSLDDVEARGRNMNDSQAVNIDGECESDFDPFSNLRRFNNDKRKKSLGKSFDSDNSSSDDFIILNQGNKPNHRKLPASNESPPAPITLGKRSSVASSITKTLKYDNCDTSQDKQIHKAIDSSAFATASPARALPSKKRKASEMNTDERNVNSNTTERVYPLLILHGWDEYDRQFYHRLDKMWKQIYDNHQTNDFYTESICRLNARIQESGFAFVRRRTLIRFTLWMQLAVGVQIRSVQQMRFSDEIKSYFCQSENSSGALGSSALSPGASATASASLGSHSTPVASSTQRIGGMDRVCRTAAMPTRLGLHTTPVASSTQRMVGTDQGYQRAVVSTSLESRLTPAASPTYQTAVMLVEKKYQTSSNKEIDLVRDARLRRFDKNSADGQGRNVSAWPCPRCTWENNFFDGNCAICDYVSPTKLPSMAVQVWSCCRCTCQNTIDRDSCSACDTPKSTSSDVSPILSSTHRPDHARSSNIATSWAEPLTSMDNTPKAASKRVARCGACGHEDHTRANATEYNCPAYFDEKEIDRREKNRLKRVQILAAEQEQIRVIEKEGVNAEKMKAEIARLHEELMRNTERTEAFRKEELKRRKQKVQRLQKRQNDT